MNRYKLTSSPRSQASAKEREFKNAWYTIAKVHKLIDDAIPSGERKGLGLFLNADEFRIGGSNAAFYEGQHDENEFYVQLFFGYTDVNRPNRTKYDVTLYISQILAMSKDVLRAEILRQVGESKNKQIYPDVERSRYRKPVAGPYNRLKTSQPKSIAQILDEVKMSDWLDDGL
jgi:hypothetical protein